MDYSWVLTQVSYLTVLITLFKAISIISIDLSLLQQETPQGK